MPPRHHSNSRELAGACVHVWVFDADFEAARNRVSPYLADRHWRFEEWLNEWPITEAQIAKRNQTENANYMRALASGISADFHFWKCRPGISDRRP